MKIQINYKNEYDTRELKHEELITALNFLMDMPQKNYVFLADYLLSIFGNDNEVQDVIFNNKRYN